MGRFIKKSQVLKWLKAKIINHSFLDVMKNNSRLMILAYNLQLRSHYLFFLIALKLKIFTTLGQTLSFI